MPIPGAAGVSVKENTKLIYNLIQGLRWIRETGCYVGIPQEANAAHEGGVTNAELLYIHSNGSPVNGIPPRPVMTIALTQDDTKTRIREMLKSADSLALRGDLAGAERELNKAGMVASSAVKKAFGSENLAPNAPSTVAKKGSSAPLVDKGSLMGAITYVIRKD